MQDANWCQVNEATNTDLIQPNCAILDQIQRTLDTYEYISDV